MFDAHVGVIEESLQFAVHQVGLGAISEAFFTTFFAQYPETRRYFEGSDIPRFGPKKFKYISEFLLDVIRHPQYAEGQIATEVMRHQMYGLKDKEYYFALIDAVQMAVKHANGEHWNETMEECWADVSQGMKAMIGDAATTYLQR